MALDLFLQTEPKTGARGWGKEKTADQIFSEASWQVGPMTFNPLYLDLVLECFQMGVGLQIPGKGAGPVSTAGGAAARPFLLPSASVSFSEKLFPICFLEFREGMGCFSPWKFHSHQSEFSTSFICEQGSPQSHHQPFPFNCKHRENCPAASGSGVLHLKHSRGS